MMKQYLAPAIFLVCSILLATLSITQIAPPTAIGDDAPDTVFSAVRAFEHVKRIAKAPHSIGTAEHEKVREYIFEQCKKYGFECEIQHEPGNRRFGWLVHAGNIHNIVGRRKGTRNGNKSILLMAHYDSQPNTPGAADNGAGVAALLETARIISRLKPSKNDIVLLFTDGEENGLLGAQAYASDSSRLAEIGVIVNLEGRGNKGVSTMFETNSDNGWIISEYGKAASHPVANSLSFEIYKQLPNDTDYSIFKKAGIPGLNHALIDGLVNYHSMTDTPENLDLDALQHHGENLSSLAKHFGNADFTATTGASGTYFNIFSTWFIRYPAAFNLWLVILCMLLAAGLVIVTIRKKTISIWGLVVGFFSLPVLACITVFVVKIFRGVLLSVYPLYDNFGTTNSYHPEYYYIAIACLGTVLIVLPFLLVASKFHRGSVVTGVLVFLALLICLWHLVAPTASYLLVLPFILVAGAQLLLAFEKTNKLNNDTVRPQLLNFVASIPALLLLPPVLHLLFIAFGLSRMMPLTMVFFAITAGLLLPFLSALPKKVSFFFILAAGATFLLSLFLGNRLSPFSIEEPLPTYLKYTLDSDQHKAVWVTSKIDPGNKRFFPGPTSDSDQMIYNPAPTHSLSPPSLTILGDTTINNKRRVTVHCSPAREGSALFLRFGENAMIHNLSIDRHTVSDPDYDGPYFGLNYFGSIQQGFSLLIEAAPGELKGYIEEVSVGLSILPFYPGYPEGVIPGPGYNSNTVTVKKEFSL
jgi:hypothetical protein